MLYVDWVLAHDPGAEPAARQLTEEIREGLYRAYEKPGRFVDGLERQARQLPPAHLPWFWDTVGHRMIRSLPKHAGRVYALARKAERDHALPVDVELRIGNARLFARAGALPAKEFTAHQKWLAGALPPERAHWPACPRTPPSCPASGRRTA